MIAEVHYVHSDNEAHCHGLCQHDEGPLHDDDNNFYDTDNWATTDVSLFSLYSMG